MLSIPRSQQKHRSNTWNVPDWRNPDEYPKPEDLSHTLWRWEFLRRHPDYREDWKTHAEASYQWQVEQASKETPIRHVPTLDDPVFRANVLYLGDRIEDDPQLFIHALDRIRKYGTWGAMPNPSIRVPAHFQFKLTFSGCLCGPDEYNNISLKENEVMFSFDLSSPLLKQVKMVHRLLKHLQVNKFGKELFRKPKKDVWPLYLRTLDARDQGVSYEKIANVLLGDNLESVSDQAAPRGKQFHEDALHLALHFPPDDLDQYFPYPNPTPIP